MNVIFCRRRVLFAITVALTALMLVAGCGNDDRMTATADVADDALEPSDIVADAQPDMAADAEVDMGADAQPDVASDTFDVVCVPYADDCPEGEYCQYVDDTLRCIAEGDVVPDPGGTNPVCPTGVCSRGGICMPMRDPFGSGPPSPLICYQPCDHNLEREDTHCLNGRHTCWPAAGPEGEPLSFGICDY
jgi:hypothetical protein